VDTVKEIRRRKGWSQKDLAEESGVGQDTISGIESGRHEPRPSTLRKLADALDVEVADFFREPAVPLAEAPKAGRPTIADVISDAADRQLALERRVEGTMLDQRHANEAMRRLREEYGLEGNDAEELVNLGLENARRKEVIAALQDRLQEREQAHS
jgi:transcriptional regulator with XRE-family HTH domain